MTESWTPPAWRPGWKEQNSMAPIIRRPFPTVITRASIAVQMPTPVKCTGPKLTLASGWKKVEFEDSPSEIKDAFDDEIDSIFGEPKYIMHYPGRIDADRITDYDGRVWSIPGDLIGEFYMEDFWVPVKSEIQCCLARGYNPHLGDDDGYHGACIGDLEGRPMTLYNELLTMFRMLNPTNDYGNEAHQMAMILIQPDGDDDWDILDRQDDRTRKFLMYEGACSDNPHPAVEALLKLRGEETLETDVFEPNPKKRPVNIERTGPMQWVANFDRGNDREVFRL